jgi:hypothetical protein
MSQAVTEEEIQTFLGDDNTYYEKRWLPFRDKMFWWAGFNWAAFFLTGAWLLWKRMYLYFFVIQITMTIFQIVVI